MTTRALPLTVRTRTVDLAAVRRYLQALGAVARHGAESPDPRETLAAARIIAEDAARDLRQLRAL